ncbi:MAG TPA: hypothetical protein PK437_13455, partial [Thiobacillaceae bacterium]|nr:hypothetical protein [Thiobacillaceae bacterium]
RLKPMSDDNKKAAANLRKLGERVRAGYARLHPITARQLAEVRAAVAKEWEQEHAGKQTAKAHRAATQGQLSGPSHSTQSKRQSRSRDHGHGH